MISKIVKLIVHNLGNFLRSIHQMYLKSAGVTIGKNCMISLRAKIDVRRGNIEIGDECVITYGCVLVSHDRSVRNIDPNDDGNGEIILGNNVCIGVNTVILRNVRIGENSVIGAGSVVNVDIPSNVVAVGNPIRIVKYITNSSTGNKV